MESLNDGHVRLNWKGDGQRVHGGIAIRWQHEDNGMWYGLWSVRKRIWIVVIFVSTLALLSLGCAAHKFPDPAHENVWMCHPPVDEKPACSQVNPPDTVPKGSKCKIISDTGGSYVVVCETRRKP